MSQASRRFTPDSVYEEIFRFLLTSIKSARSFRSAESFVNVILTRSEKLMIGKRIAIAFLLRKGGSYEDISSILRVSRTTIARVNNKLESSTSFQRFVDRVLTQEKIELGLFKIVERLGKAWGYGKGGAFWRGMREIAEKERKRSIVNKV